MSSHATITIMKSREETQRLWDEPGLRPGYIEGTDAAVTFRNAPGDRGTEIHVDLERATAGGTLGEMILKLGGKEPLAKVKDDLRRFKQRAETGEIAVSDAVPQGELAERKLKQRPAQPVELRQREGAGV